MCSRLALESMLLLLQNPEITLNAILCKPVVAVDGDDARNIASCARVVPCAAAPSISLCRSCSRFSAPFVRRDVPLADVTWSLLSRSQLAARSAGCALLSLW